MADQTHKANTDEVNKSVDAWRASQGLPPIDRSQTARHPKEEKRGK